MDERDELSADTHLDGVRHRRLWWWFTFYLPLVALFITHPGQAVQNPLLPLVLIFLMPPIIPLFLGYDVLTLIDWFSRQILHTRLVSDTGPLGFFVPFYLVVCIGLSYVAFVLHWRISMKTKSKRQFLLLMVVLFILVGSSIFVRVMFPDRLFEGLMPL